MAVQSRKIFVDSSIFISFIDRADSNHSRGVKIMESLAKAGSQLYTSSLAVNEVYSALSREAGMSVALDFLQAIIQSDIEVIYPQKADYIASHRMLRANKERQLTLREVLSATIMQRREVTQILTFNYWHNLFGSYVNNLALA